MTPLEVKLIKALESAQLTLSYIASSPILPRGRGEIQAQKELEKIKQVFENIKEIV